MEEGITVGIGRRNYSYKRVAYGLPVPKTRFRKYPYFPWHKVTSDSRRLNTFQPLPAWFKVDGLHLWNGIPVGKKPFITSFEHDLPRYCGLGVDNLYKRSLRSLEAPVCRRLLALSEYAKREFLALNRGLADCDLLREKTEVFYGAIWPKTIPVNQNASDCFTLTFVGHDFFRKGGLGILQAFKILSHEFSSKNLRLRVASRLDIGDYVTHADESVRNSAIHEIQSLENVEWRRDLSQEQVMEWFAESDLALMPTLDDTFGWSALEPLVVGVPVVGTNVCAMPEIIGEDRGFQISLPITDTGRWIGMSMKKRSQERRLELEKANTSIAEAICRIVGEFIEDRSRLRKFGENGAIYASNQHSPERQGLKLRSIYETAFLTG